jgi:hypothetical protein
MPPARFSFRSVIAQIYLWFFRVVFFGMALSGTGMFFITAREVTRDGYVIVHGARSTATDDFITALGIPLIGAAVGIGMLFALRSRK